MSNCITIKGGDRIRITRVDGCGRPLYGDECGQIVTKGIVEFKMSPEVEEAEEKSQKNFAGEFCYSEAGCDQVKWWTIELTWCEINISAFQFMNPNHHLVKDPTTGEIIGYYPSNRIDCSGGYALEVWLQLVAGGGECGGEETGGGQWGYIFIPWISGSTPQEITIGGEDTITWVTSGRAKIGGAWGKGPYEVTFAEGAPQRLPEPLGPDSPYGLLVTTLEPPEDQCDCMPIPRPVPDPADLTVTAVDKCTLEIKPDNHGMGAVTVDWGSKAPDCKKQTVPDLSKVRCCLPDGEHTIKVCDAATPEICRDITVTAPLDPAKDAPQVDFTCGDDGRTVTFEVEIPVYAAQAGDGIVLLDLKHPPGVVEVRVDKATGKGTYVHTYPDPGEGNKRQYNITAKRKDFPGKITTKPVIIPCESGPGPANPKA
ncbi:hypothetical protein ACMATS_06080 [Streptoverticillium reticulum]|uniref:hypothetical protein n=1 Tax=Streptoverticillium reticulum TaxID=1433415 RepID=UPI0039BF6F62